MNRGHRNCEICGIQEKRCSGKVLFARFPLLEHICKQWVKAVGKEDLIHLPIEKLHDLRYVCGRHFENRRFTKTKTRLKKNAVPTLQLTMPPLPDELLEGFPLHMAGKNQGVHPPEITPEQQHRNDIVTKNCDGIVLHCFPNPEKDADRFRTWLYAIGGDVLSLDNRYIHKSRRVCHKHFELKHLTWSKRLSPNATPTLHLPGNDIQFPSLCSSR